MIPNVSPKARSARRAYVFLIALAGVTALALLIRSHRLDAQSLYMDEFWQVGSYELPVSYVVTRAAAQGYPPLDYLIGVGLNRIGLSDSDWWVRFPAALFGAGGVWLFGFWMRRVAGDFAGVVAAALLAICPLHVFMSQEARPYTIFVFLALATILTYSRARRRNGFAAWTLYGASLWMLLLTRWDGPHFILAGIALFALGAWWRARRVEEHFSAKRIFALQRKENLRAPAPHHEPEVEIPSIGAMSDARTGLEQEVVLFRRAFIASLIAVACYNPVLGIILEHNRHALGAESGTFLSIAGATLREAYVAMIHGYSPRTLQAADGPVAWLIVGAALSTIGLLSIFRFARRGGTDAAVLFMIVAVPFPLVYAFVYSMLSTFAPKPQYLLFLCVPLFGTIAAGVEAIRRALARYGPKMASVAAVLLAAVIALPMMRASATAITTVQRRDWRGVYSFLRDHASPHDAFASVGSQTIPTYHEPIAPGTERYLRLPVRFAKIGPDTHPAELETPPWQDHANTLWLLCYTNRLYEQEEPIPPPRDLPSGRRVYAFEGLFLIEARYESAALDRLADALAALYADLPDHRSLIAPAIFLHRYYLERGDVVSAEFWEQKAFAQCRPTDSRELLTQRFAVVDSASLAHVPEPTAIGLQSGRHSARQVESP